MGAADGAEDGEMPSGSTSRPPVRVAGGRGGFLRRAKGCLREVLRARPVAAGGHLLPPPVRAGGRMRGATARSPGSRRERWEATSSLQVGNPPLLEALAEVAVCVQGQKAVGRPGWCCRALNCLVAVFFCLGHATALFPFAVCSFGVSRTLRSPQPKKDQHQQPGSTRPAAIAGGGKLAASLHPHSSWLLPAPLASPVSSGLLGWGLRARGGCATFAAPEPLAGRQGLAGAAVLLLASPQWLASTGD